MSALARHPVAVIVVAQLFGTSLWFSPNSAAENLVRAWSLTTAQLGHLTSAVQIGFIAGTLLLATTGLADRFAASRVFAVSSLLGAIFNAAFAFLASSLSEAIALRFLVGLCLAGIYPLGMKMVIAWTRGSAGSTLGLLVGMLTLGTALPHGVRAVGADLSWQGVIFTSSLLAVAGGTAVFFLGEGPFLTRRAIRKSIQWGSAFHIFEDRNFRACAMGYFGHMWELYAFWTAVPFLVSEIIRGTDIAAQSQAVSAVSFCVIGVGVVGCVAAGQLSRRFGSPKVAATALAISGLLCLMYPLFSRFGLAVSIALLTIWGTAVIADSGQFSSIAARVCPPDVVGSALAIQNSIGFLITVVSITLVTSNIQHLGNWIGWLLLPGPVVGLLFFKRLVNMPHDQLMSEPRTTTNSAPRPY